METKSLQEKIEMVKTFCLRFNEEQTHYGGTYWISVYSENGELKTRMSTCGSFGAFYVLGVKTRSDIEKELIDYYKLYP